MFTFSPFLPRGPASPWQKLSIHT